MNFEEPYPVAVATEQAPLESRDFPIWMAPTPSDCGMGNRLPPLFSIFPGKFPEATPVDDSTTSYLTCYRRQQNSPKRNFAEIGRGTVVAERGGPVGTATCFADRDRTANGLGLEIAEKAPKKRTAADSRRSPNVNLAFQNLRRLIPTEPIDRRLSKVETLRLAVSYIQHLDQTLSSDVFEEHPCLAVHDEQNGDPICTFCMSKRRKKYAI